LLLRVFEEDITELGDGQAAGILHPADVRGDQLGGVLVRFGAGLAILRPFTEFDLLLADLDVPSIVETAVKGLLTHDANLQYGAIGLSVD
jgi:hypothetical protein